LVLSQSNARFILKNIPNGRIALLYQNDDFGKDYFTPEELRSRHAADLPVAAATSSS
jgi:hypothetical protein